MKSLYKNSDAFLNQTKFGFIHDLSSDQRLQLAWLLLAGVESGLLSSYFKENQDVEDFREQNAWVDDLLLEKFAILRQQQEEQRTNHPIRTAMKKREVISFESWNSDDVEQVFGLKAVKNHPLLLEWMETPSEAWGENEKAELEKLKLYLQDRVDTFNEEELKIFFVAKLLELLDYEKRPDYRPYLERKLFAQIQEVSVSGVVDFMIASGKKKPIQPYFCLHEYKKELGNDRDPLGQLLIAMLAARSLNEKAFPMYGSYVVGRQWFLVILAEQEYSVSLAYDVTKDELFSLFHSLKKVKEYIEKQL